jgi:hypothetical protein
VLYNTLLSLGYKGDTPIYRCWLSIAHDVEVYEDNVTIPIDPSKLWSGSIIASEPNTVVEMMANTALTYLSESRLTAIVALPTTLLPIWDQENPMWWQRLEATSDRGDPHLSAKTTSLAKYT